MWNMASVGKRAGKMQRFVKNLCQDHGIRCHIFSVEVPVFAEKHGLGLSEARRILRYECYKKAAESVKRNFKRRLNLRWRIMRRITQKRFCFRWCAEAD